MEALLMCLEGFTTVNIDFFSPPQRWSFLKVLDMRRQGDPTTDEEIAYLAGVAEGNLTASLMLMQWKNTMDTYCDSNPDLCSKIEDYIVMNSDYIDNAADSTDPRWYQVTARRHTCTHSRELKGTIAWGDTFLT